jgi:cytochrome c oxidase cbb3-type subunit 4
VDFITLSSIMTVVAFATFVGIVLWAYSGKARRSFDEAARLPFDEDKGAQDRDRETRR